MSIEETYDAALEKLSYMQGPDLAVVEGELTSLLAILRAQYLNYQTSHWQTSGLPYYGDHLLFERLYKSVQEEVDTLAEKIVGYLGSKPVSIFPSVVKITRYVNKWAQIDGHANRGLASEQDLQSSLKHAYDTIKELGHMSLGLDDFLMATANAHEANVYLLQQRMGGA